MLADDARAEWSVFELDGESVCENGALTAVALKVQSAVAVRCADRPTQNQHVGDRTTLDQNSETVSSVGCSELSTSRRRNAPPDATESLMSDGARCSNPGSACSSLGTGRYAESRNGCVSADCAESVAGRCSATGSAGVAAAAAGFSVAVFLIHDLT